MYRRIRELWEDRDLTQREVSGILNCSQQVYSNYEPSYPSSTMCPAIIFWVSATTRKSTDDLFYDEKTAGSSPAVCFLFYEVRTIQTPLLKQSKSASYFRYRISSRD